METMPQNRPVWGFSSDDAHGTVGIGFSYNIMYMPVLTEEAAREAMETGAFVAAARVARIEGVNEYIRDEMVMPGIAQRFANFMHNDPMPGISEIVMRDNKIIISGTDYDVIEWIADGKIIAQGGTLDFNMPHVRQETNSYVRAQLKSATGIIFTQPFGITLCCGDGRCRSCDECGKCLCDAPDCQQTKCTLNHLALYGADEPEEAAISVYVPVFSCRECLSREEYRSVHSYTNDKVVIYAIITTGIILINIIYLIIKTLKRRRRNQRRKIQMQKRELISRENLE
jgi:hypothetical protein